jgi:alkylation response protein AidB-like acyl-CoA dehydrogenase
MYFDLTDEQKLFADQVGHFARDNLASGALKRAHDPRFPYDVAQLMANQGLMGIALPEHDAGQGGTLMMLIAIEQSLRCVRAAPTWCSSAISVRSASSPNMAAKRRRKR